MTTHVSFGRRIVLSPFFWCIAWLLVLDVASGIGLRVMAARHPESSLVRYFDYGRSIEGKLERLVALPPDDARAQVLAAGWLDPADWQRLPAVPERGSDLLVAVYGQSFTRNAAAGAAKLDGHLTLRQIAGPAAPLDHSYAALKLDQGLRRADVVVVGILASAVAHIGSMSGLDWTFENPAPFTFPHFGAEPGPLVGETPAFTTLAGFRTAFTGQTPDWQRFRQQLARHDRGYDPLVFDRTPLDASNFVKLLRRGWIAHSAGYETGVYSSRSGFAAESGPVRAMKAIVPEMARLAGARGERLIVLLVHDQGYADHLYRALGETLTRAHVEFISTHDLFEASDPGNFVADGHYTEAANLKLAAALRTMIRRGGPAAASSGAARGADAPAR